MVFYDVILSIGNIKPFQQAGYMILLIGKLSVSL